MAMMKTALEKLARRASMLEGIWMDMDDDSERGGLPRTILGVVLSGED
jgi:hypothetical protein